MKRISSNYIKDVAGNDSELENALEAHARSTL